MEIIDGQRDIHPLVHSTDGSTGAPVEASRWNRAPSPRELLPLVTRRSEAGSSSSSSLGFHHTCAEIGEDVLCWARKERGQLGQGKVVQVGDDEPANAIGSLGFGLPITKLDGDGQFTCAPG